MEEGDKLRKKRAYSYSCRCVERGGDFVSVSVVHQERDMRGDRKGREEKRGRRERKGNVIEMRSSLVGRLRLVTLVSS
jgi:hypothetical protein